MGRVIWIWATDLDGNKVSVKMRQNGVYKINDPFWSAARMALQGLSADEIHEVLARIQPTGKRYTRLDLSTMRISPTQVIMEFIIMGNREWLDYLTDRIEPSPRSIASISAPFKRYHVSDTIFEIAKVCNCTIISMHHKQKPE